MKDATYKVNTAAALAASAAGGASLASDYDDADAFGLDEFGQPVGINPMWGAVGASGIGTLTSVGIRQFTKSAKMRKYSELIGFGAAAVPSGVMLIWGGTRAAGWTGLFTALLNHGPRIIENMLSKKEEVAQTAVEATEAAKESGTMGRYPGSMMYGGGMQGVEIIEQPALAGQQGMGLVTPEAVRALGQAPHEELPQLVGSHLSQAQDQVSLLGGPNLASIGQHFGSTHFNK